MNVEPIIDSYSYLLYQTQPEKTKTASKDFQKFLAETVYGPAFAPEEDMATSIDDEEDDSVDGETFKALSPVEKDMYNQMMRSAVAEVLAKQDVFGLDKLVQKFLNAK